jgi:DNA helicase IV
MKDEDMQITDTISFKQYSDLQCDKGYGGKVYVQQDNNFYIIKEDKIAKTTKENFINNCDKKECVVLSRTNKNVKRMQALGFENTMTVHQAKGLEFDNVIVINNDSDDIEEVNINYVALTRARNKMLIADIEFFENNEI